ncbi:MAG: hypothetical protein K8F27_09775 [Sulfuricellaceae bacterium]|nr:hypothetical protein [Sulfuricellaceae bacterium]
MARVFSKFRYLAFVALAMSLQACAKDYSAGPIEAWVVDAETGQPLEGVIVTANWQLEIGTPGGNVPAGQMMVMETVTDKNGRLYFPGWGPKPIPGRPKSKSSRENTLLDYLLSSEPHLVNRDPQLLLFKSVYKYVGLENKFTIDYNKGPLRSSDWNGKTIKMERFNGTLEEYYSKSLMFLKGDLGFAYNGQDCEWQSVPRMVAALLKEERRFQENNIAHGLPPIITLPNQQKCGSAQKFLKDYLK